MPRIYVPSEEFETLLEHANQLRGAYWQFTAVIQDEESAFNLEQATANEKRIAIANANASHAVITDADEAYQRTLQQFEFVGDATELNILLGTVTIMRRTSSQLLLAVNATLPQNHLFH
jgi:hypothetical protein